MKKLAVILICLILCSCGSEGSSETGAKTYDKNNLLKINSASATPDKAVKSTLAENKETGCYEPLNYDIQKGIWLSYIDLEPMLTGKSKEEFRENFKEACENICELGCNTVYVHLRPFGDALYKSELYPASRYAAGQVGQAADFDPLEIMAETAHEYKLSVHGWINPLRCEREAEFDNISDEYQIKQWYKEMENNDKIKRVEGDEHLWLDPAYEDVRELIAEGAKEIAENYDIDGIHFDDYFYPTTDKDFDSMCYGENGGGEALEQWRKDNISAMVSLIYTAVKSVDENILVGISPQGNIENNYNFMYADVSLWGSEQGYCDYLEPQIYFGYNNSSKPFLQTVKDWQGLVSNENVKLVIGLGAYKIFSEEEFADTEGIIAKQIADSMQLECSGIGIYTYNSIFSPENDYARRMESEKEQIKQAFVVENN